MLKKGPIISFLLLDYLFEIRFLFLRFRFYGLWIWLIKPAIEIVVNFLSLLGGGGEVLLLLKWLVLLVVLILQKRFVYFISIVLLCLYLLLLCELCLVLRLGRILRITRALHCIWKHLWVLDLFWSHNWRLWLHKKLIFWKRFIYCVSLLLLCLNLWQLGFMMGLTRIVLVIRVVNLGGYGFLHSFFLWL